MNASSSKSLLSVLLMSAVAACAVPPVTGDPPVDPKALTVAMTAPGDGATGIGLSPALVIQFSAPIDEASLSVTLAPVSALGAHELNADGTEVSFANVVLTASTPYTVTVSAVGKAGEVLASAYSFSFTTGSGAADTSKPTVMSSVPASGALSVPANQVLSLTFSEPMDTAGVAITLEPAQDLGEGVWSLNDTVLTFPAPAAELVAGQLYSLTLVGSDKAGNIMQAAAPITFTVPKPADSVLPTVIATTPAPAAMAVSNNTTISLTFSEEMDQASVNAAIVVSPSASGIVTWDPTGTLRTLSAKGLAANTQYTVTVGIGARDLAGNAIAAPMQRAFDVIKQGTLVLNPVAASDGYIRSDGPTVYPIYSTIHAGDFGSGVSLRSFLTFDLSPVPANTARITTAAIYVYQMQLKGNPAGTLGGNAKLERVNFGETLDAADMNVARYMGLNDSVDFLIGAADGWKANSSIALGVWNDFQNRASRGNLTQFRLRYPTASTGAATQNYVSFYAGESADTDCPRPNSAAVGSSCKPHMIIIYEYP